MNQLDRFVVEKFVPFREQMLEAVRDKFPQVVHLCEKMLEGKENYVGMQVLDNGKVAGEYTFKLNGVKIADTKTGELAPKITHPFFNMILKLYIVAEKNTLEQIAEDKKMLANPLEEIQKYLPQITIKFLK